jgi:SNF2 family DNA or RNA helicase
MIVLHLSLHDGRFFLWGEASPDEAKPRRPRAQRGAPKASVFDAGEERLTAAWRAAALPTIAAKPQSLLAWLPSAGGGPFPSSPLIAEPPDATPNIAPWQVTACALEPDAVYELLSACLDRDPLAPGVLAGRTLEFWAQLLRFAATLVTRQSFLPAVIEQDGAFAARWLPMPSGADTGRLSTLASAMPAACRALSSLDAQTAPTTPAMETLRDGLGVLTDHLVRSAFLPEKKTKAQKWESLHDQWLHALQTPDATLSGTPKELRELSAQIAQWKSPLAHTQAAPFRLCFRLDEPPAPEEDSPKKKSSNSWQVQYLLQAQDDPSLLVPAEAAWKPQSRAAKVLRREDFRPREYLLTALGQAGAMYPPIEASLKQAAPAGFALDATGAHQFLSETAWLLENAGYGVLLPAWWTRRGTKLHLAARAKVKTPQMQGGGGLSLEELVKFEWEVALGDQVLSFKELEELARLKEPLVRVRGQWVQLDAEEIQAAIAFWKQKGDALTAREMMKMALGAQSSPDALPLENVQATGWAGELLTRLRDARAIEELPPPAGLQADLRPYQARGYAWLDFLQQWGLGACLADDMGLGKTIQTLTLLQRQWESTPARQRRPALLICPTSVTGNWQREAARFTPDLPVMVHHGLDRRKGTAFQKAAKKQAIVVSSYGLLQRDHEVLKEVNWRGVILDEAQNIKNPVTKTAQAARALEADFRIALTGTPVENHIGDLWSIMEFLNPGLLSKQAEFKRNFFNPIQLEGDQEASQKLQQLTGPFILRRLKTDKSVIADLPAKMEMKVFCTLTKEQASLYAAVTEDAAKALDEAEDGIGRKGLVLATLTKLKQVCNHPAQFLGDNSAIADRSGKLARLTEMLEEALSAGDRALIFTQFTEMGGMMRRHLQETFGEEVLFLHGATTKKARDKMVERFQSNGKGPRLFILSLKAGGTGLNLTAANHVFHFDRWWNPAVENQATDRAFRIGQTKNVQVHKFLCAGTLEEKIDEMIETKKAVAERVVGSGEGWLTKLSTDELKEIFTLRTED